MAIPRRSGKFDTQLAWSLYEVHKTYTATAKALSEYLEISITPEALSARFVKEGLVERKRSGRPIEPGSMLGGVRTKKWRERKALKESDTKI